MERIFSDLIVITVVVTVFSLGLVLTPAAVGRTARRGRVLVLALAANVLVVPCLAWMIASVLPLSPAETTGVVLVAVGAGGSLSLKAIQISGRGDAALALSLVVVLEVLDVVAVPAWLRLVSPADAVVLGAPLRSVAVTVLAPMVLGVLVAWRWPGRARGWAAPLGVASTVGLVAVVVTGVLAYRTDLSRDLWSWVAAAAALIGVVAVGAGWVAGHGAGRWRSKGQQPGGDTGGTVAVVTACRFSSLGLLIVDRTFAGDAGVHSPAIVAALVLLVISLTYALLLRAGGRSSGTARTAPSRQPGRVT